MGLKYNSEEQKHQVTAYFTSQHRFYPNRVEDNNNN